MSRVDQFYKKYSMETPEEKKEREELELKAKKKEARKAKALVKKKVAEEMGDFTGINKDWEGKLIKKMTEEKEAEKTSYDHLDEVIAKYNLAVAHDYVAVDKGFLNKLVEDTKLNVQEENDKMNAEQIKSIVTEVMAAMNENKNTELALQIKLQEAQNDALRMQLELAHLAMDKHLASMEGKVEEVEAVTQVEEQFEEKPKKTKRVGRPKKQVVEVEVVKSISGAVADENYNPVPAEFMTSRGINWKAVREAGQFEHILICIIRNAERHGINVANGKEFKAFSTTSNGAYQQFMMVNKGTRGAWKQFIEQRIEA